MTRHANDDKSRRKAHPSEKRGRCTCGQMLYAFDKLCPQCEEPSPFYRAETPPPPGRVMTRADA